MKYLFVLLFLGTSTLFAQFGIPNLENRLAAAEDSLTFYYQEESRLTRGGSDMDLIVAEHKVDLWETKIKLLSIQIELERLSNEHEELINEYYRERAKLDSLRNIIQ